MAHSGVSMDTSITLTETRRPENSDNIGQPPSRPSAVRYWPDVPARERGTGWASFVGAVKKPLRGRRPPLLILCVLLLLLACSAWSLGYQVIVGSEGKGHVGLCTEGEDFGTRGDFDVGSWWLSYQNDAEYVTLVVILDNPAHTVQIEVWYCDGNGDRMAGEQEKLTLQGGFVVLRLRHPLWLPGRVL